MNLQADIPQDLECSFRNDMTGIIDKLNMKTDMDIKPPGIIRLTLHSRATRENTFCKKKKTILKWC